MLCNRCKSIFVRWRDRWPSWPKEGGSTGSSWGDYRYLFEADIRDCQLCKDLRRAFIDQGVGRSTEFPNDMGGEIYSILHSTSLYFSAWKIPPTHESRLEGYRKLNLRSSIGKGLSELLFVPPLIIVRRSIAFGLQRLSFKYRFQLRCLLCSCKGLDESLSRNASNVS